MVNFVIAVFVRLLVMIRDAVPLAQSGELVLVGAQSDELRVEVGDVALEYRSGIAARIDRHEEYPNLGRLRAEGMQSVGQHGERGRAFVRTLRVAEVKHHDIVTVIGGRDRLAVLVGQVELEGRHEARDVLQGVMRVAADAARQRGRQDEGDRGPLLQPSDHTLRAGCTGGATLPRGRRSEASGSWRM